MEILGSNEYSVSSNDFIKNLDKRDKLSAILHVQKKHTFDNPLGIPQAEFTTEEFQNLVNHLNIKRNTYRSHPLVVADSFITIFNQYFVINKKNSPFAIKIIEEILNELFSCQDWHPSRAYKYAKKSIEKLSSLPQEM